jgi:hypothetical protein
MAVAPHQQEKREEEREEEKVEALAVRPQTLEEGEEEIGARGVALVHREPAKVVAVPRRQKEGLAVEVGMEEERELVPH